MKLQALPLINSKHFNWKEFLQSPTADKLGIHNYPLSVEIIQNLKVLSQTLSRLRESFGKPILINSGYRCPSLNRAVGGHPKSFHQYGKAADIRCLTEDLTYQLYIFCDQSQKDPRSGIRKVIYEKGKTHWIHLEIY